MSAPVRRVVIVGGGSAGWMTAAYLSRALQQTATITVVESPTVSTIGVGEATIPNLQRVFFDHLGIPEEEWIRHCNASLKTAIKFVNWRAPAVNGLDNHFYHTFRVPPTVDGVPLSHYWFQRLDSGTQMSYANACLIEPPMLDAKLSPVHMDGRPVTNYAWHFSADQLVQYLQRFSTGRQGVRHIRDDVDGVILNHRGFVSTLKTRRGQLLHGDLFVDCTGFRGFLINETLGEPFVPYERLLAVRPSHCRAYTPTTTTDTASNLTPPQSPCEAAGRGRFPCPDASVADTCIPADAQANPRPPAIFASSGVSTNRRSTSAT